MSSYAQAIFFIAASRIVAAFKYLSCTRCKHRIRFGFFLYQVIVFWLLNLMCADTEAGNGQKWGNCR